ncbi:hypothetical protein FDP41_008995 [Naegleria fowleri]|uniref:Uncharacterized protein n=1 Tax=Naegleria fowleri TaxID=5763 RepID=A0A6A5BDH4_NAEFO|nr:uncharacterized protein FDP41_008995 [Naegleria fowleri]KAF0972746.1 hypothetical protein FDP41_008995 [Naegleria fowleri]CAG4715646.1 unnamed protein product [Naegleria fowleri]
MKSLGIRAILLGLTIGCSIGIPAGRQFHLYFDADAIEAKRKQAEENQQAFSETEETKEETIATITNNSNLPVEVNEAPQSNNNVSSGTPVSVINNHQQSADVHNKIIESEQKDEEKTTRPFEGGVFNLRRFF